MLSLDDIFACSLLFGDLMHTSLPRLSTARRLRRRSVTNLGEGVQCGVGGVGSVCRYFSIVAIEE
jgi:hypothetical protein